MSVSTERRHMTAQELAAVGGDGRFELIDGELRTLVPAGGDHGTIALSIGALIHAYARERGGRAFAAETGFQLSSSPDTVRAPDAAYVEARRAAEVGASPGYWPGAPDVAVEVVSPHDTYSELHEKALGWLAAGASVVLVADPRAGHVTRYRSATDVTVHGGQDELDCSGHARIRAHSRPTALALSRGRQFAIAAAHPGR
jgi:Uma2 family endonuclease